MSDGLNREGFTEPPFAPHYPPEHAYSPEETAYEAFTARRGAGRIAWEALDPEERADWRRVVSALARRARQSQPAAGPPPEALDIAWNALQHIALHGDDKSASKARETLRAVNEYLEDGTTEDGIDRTPRPAPELAAAMAETRKMRDVVCKLLDLYGAPDDRLMQHSSVTRATLQRYAAEAGVRLDGLDG